MSIKKVLIGDTVKLTWINSGTTPSSIVASVYNGSELMVDSGSMVDSGNGHYYFNHTVVNSTGFYSGEINATISSLNYKRKIKFKAVTGEVD